MTHNDVSNSLCFNSLHDNVAVFFDNMSTFILSNFKVSLSRTCIFNAFSAKNCLSLTNITLQTFISNKEK